MNEKIAVETLRQIKNFLDEQHVEFWLDSGTLLGAVREGKFISWDGDIDLGAWHKDFNKIASIAECFHGKEKEFEIHFGLSHVGIINRRDNKKCVVSIDTYYKMGDKAVTSPSLIHPRERYFLNGEIKTDIIKSKIRYMIKYFIWLLSSPDYAGDGPRFISRKTHLMLLDIAASLPAFYRRCLTRLLNKISVKLGYKSFYIALPLKYLRELSTITFYGMEFKVPSPVEEYLEYRYGKGWRIPKKNYIWYKEDGAICLVEV